MGKGPQPIPLPSRVLGVESLFMSQPVWWALHLTYATPEASRQPVGIQAPPRHLRSLSTPQESPHLLEAGSVVRSLQQRRGKGEGEGMQGTRHMERSMN